MDITKLHKPFKMNVPIKDGEWWNGIPAIHDFSNLKQWVIRRSQGFAENPAIYAQFNMKGHNGLDIAYHRYTPVVAPLKLYVTWTELGDRGYGNNVWGETEAVIIDGIKVKLEMVFGHLDSISVQPYKWVEIGIELGKGDDTGFSSGHHLHFGIRPYIFTNGVWRQMLMNNGYAGYTEVEPFLIQQVRWTMGELLDLTTNNMQLQLVQKIGDKDVYIIEPKGAEYNLWKITNASFLNSAQQLKWVVDWNKIQQVHSFDELNGKYNIMNIEFAAIKE